MNRHLTTVLRAAPRVGVWPVLCTFGVFMGAIATETSGAGQGDRNGSADSADLASTESGTEPKTAGAKDSSGPRERLERVGVDASQFRRLTDGIPMNAEEQEVLLKLLYHVRRFDPVRVDRWTRRVTDWTPLAEQPEAHRAQIFALRGRVKQITVERPPAEVVDRYEMDRYYRCRIELEGTGGVAWLYTRTIPKRWDIRRPLDQRVGARALFIKVGAGEGKAAELVFVADRLAWYPDQMEPPGPNMNSGLVLLGGLGMDAGLWDSVVQKRSISSEEREAFYQLLHAVGQASNRELVTAAEKNLKSMAEVWHDQLEALESQLEKTRAKGGRENTSEREREEADERSAGQTQQEVTAGARDRETLRSEAAMARTSWQAAVEGHYPVARLFNLPESEIGQIVLLEGVARRAIKIHTDTPLAEGGSDIVDRFKIDGYWEIEFYTRDSRDNPITFCVRELPRGFPTGDQINEPVRVVGFFFKSWSYRRGTPNAGQSATNHDGGGRASQPAVRQLAPLIVGRAPIWTRQPETDSDPIWGVFAGGMFVLALMGVALWMWRANRSDRRFEREIIGKRLRGASDESLDVLATQANDGPRDVNSDGA